MNFNLMILPGLGATTANCHMLNPTILVSPFNHADGTIESAQLPRIHINAYGFVNGSPQVLHWTR